MALAHQISNLRHYSLASPEPTMPAMSTLSVPPQTIRVKRKRGDDTTPVAFLRTYPLLPCCCLITIIFLVLLTLPHPASPFRAPWGKLYRAAEFLGPGARLSLFQRLVMHSKAVLRQSNW